ncbi:sodium- and chloride-dependent glycine transporter 2 isoform X2 [Parasteatoda tepidariorum]|uniref:sodium- and chloride-dependent glycine transporter 2 isoform X2 n=1 Tax=Parasteatoda tepidariorum TaxID=114398 RepID=UPI001C71CCCB|nr:sodium- and chloride-dependent glycine transporter 2 isoform X2 [Parasteatoda tepidariorum]
MATDEVLSSRTLNNNLDKKTIVPEQQNITRDKWSNKAEFLLSCIGLSVGIGNVWRFPYLAYKNGGGAFLVAYIVLLVLVGKPHFFAELALGQFSSCGSVRIWRCFPIAKGVGIAMIIISVLIAIYYNVIMAYTLYYIGQSFRAQVPWQECQNWWGADEGCYVRKNNQTSCWEIPDLFSSTYNTSTDVNATVVTNDTWKDKIITTSILEYQNALNACSNGTQTASEQFWERYVLQLTPSIDNLGTIKWDLALTLLFCWIIVFLGLLKGIKSSGKVVYFTATFPYVILIILLIYGCTLNGALEGIKYFVIPDWRQLLKIQVWRAAAEQLLFSLSIGCGSLIMYASYNEFENKLYMDAMLVSSLDFITSLIAGIVIFSVLGNMSTEMGIDISKVAKGGQGLAFVTYPEAIARLPLPQLWSVLFFFMLFLLAIDSEGGQYVLNLMDTYAGGYAGIFIATIEISALMWGYGADRFADDIGFMLGFTPGIYWRICWKYISPTVLWFVLIYSLGTHSIITYGGKPYPKWAEGIGWLMIAVSVLQIPIWALIQLYRYKDDIRSVFQPDPDWGPLEPKILQQYKNRNSIFVADKGIPEQGIINLGMVMLPEDCSITIQK